MDPEAFVTTALEHVESQSIRDWVNSQRPMFVELAASWLRKAEEKRAKQAPTPGRFATYIVCLAIGA